MTAIVLKQISANPSPLRRWVLLSDTSFLMRRLGSSPGLHHCSGTIPSGNSGTLKTKGYTKVIVEWNAQSVSWRNRYNYVVKMRQCWRKV